MTNYKMMLNTIEEAAYALVEQEYCESCPYNKEGI